jgi:hypothetical protein
MTRRTSEVAICCSNDSLRSVVRCRSSLSSRAFSSRADSDSSSAAGERRGRAVPVPPEGCGSAAFGRRVLTDRPALECRLMGLPEIYERHGSGLGLCAGSVALFIAIEVMADVLVGYYEHPRCRTLRTQQTRWQTGVPPDQIDSCKCRRTTCF